MPYELLDIESSTGTSLPKSESNLQTGLRGGARTLARGTEAILGLPGDIASGALGLTNLAIEKATGKPSPLPQDQKIFPTSENLKEVTQNLIEKPFLPEGYLQPQSEREEFYDNVISDMAQLAFPLKGKIPLKSALKGAGISSLAGNLASETFKSLGGIRVPFTDVVIGDTPAQRGLIKGGTMLLSSLWGPAGIKSYSKSQYNIADKAIPEGASLIFGPKLNDGLNILDKLYHQGKLGADMKRGLQHFKSNINKGKVSVKDLWDFKKDINEWYPSVGKSAKREISNAAKSFAKELENYGQKHNKTFLNAFKNAEDVHAGIYKANIVNDFLQEHLNSKKLGSAAALLLLGGNPGKIPVSIGGALLTRELSKGLNAIKNSPAARKYYKDIIVAAGAKDAAKLNKSAKKFDEAINKSKQSGWELVDTE